MNIRSIRESDFIVYNTKTGRACFANRADIVAHIAPDKVWTCDGGPLALLDNVHTMRVKYQDATLCNAQDILGGE